MWARKARLSVMSRGSGSWPRSRAFPAEPGDAVERAAREWTGLEPAPGSAPRLPRAMRPLVLLRGLALRGEGGSPFLRFLTALRLGLLGR
jgi:hypothetical protein